jgi:2-polyprenyl-6-methoxyphenol hydroxylase-like FAD-dependent oxidoreductase
VFASDQGGELVVACQWEQVTERDGERITTLKRDLLSSENGKTRLMVVSTSIDSAVRQLLDQEAISWREIPRKEFRHFLSEEGDLNLSELFLTKNTP